MQKPSIPQLVYSRLFPNPKATDPRDFDSHVQRNLIQEVRSETVCFYGPIDCLEAQYPGLDYSNPSHRVRLGRYLWHNKLFNVFDELRLTNLEIQTLCKWEGTRWTRENYEKSEGVTIKDTTWDHIAHAGYRAPTATRTSPHGLREVDQETGEINEDQAESEEEELEGEEDDEEMGDSDLESVNDADEEESEDEISQSIGNDLNRRLLLAADARARGEDVVLDPDWEQWLKEAAERGDGPHVFGLLGGTNLSQAATAHQQMPYSPSGTDPSSLEAEEEDSQSDYVPPPPSTSLGTRAASNLGARDLVPNLTPLHSGSIVGSTSTNPSTEAAA